jgi:hypothetical protein
MGGARFHAYTVDHHVSALALADLLDALEDIFFVEVDNVGSTRLSRHGDALRNGLDCDDAFRTEYLGRLDREQTDRSCAPNSHDFSALDAGLLGSLIARRKNVGEEEHLLIAAFPG